MTAVNKAKAVRQSLAVRDRLLLVLSF